MRKAVVAAALALSLPAGLMAQVSDGLGTRLDWGNMEVELYPTRALGMQLEISAEATRPLQQVHGITGGFEPESVLTWLNSAAVVITPTTRPRDRTQALLTPVLVSSSGDSIRLMRRSRGTKWEKRVVVMVDSPGAHHDRFDLLVLPREATDLLNGLQRQAMLSGFDPDSVAATLHPPPGEISRELVVADPPRLLSVGPMHNPDRSQRGRVVMHFVVDTTGRVDPTSVRPIMADHVIFIDAARAMVLGSRYAPGRVHGDPVRVMVQQTIYFAP